MRIIINGRVDQNVISSEIQQQAHLFDSPQSNFCLNYNKSAPIQARIKEHGVQFAINVVLKVTRPCSAAWAGPTIKPLAIMDRNSGQTADTKRVFHLRFASFPFESNNGVWSLHYGNVLRYFCGLQVVPLFPRETRLF